MKLFSFIIVALILVVALSSCTRVISAHRYKVLKVIDGDTIKILYNGEETSVRYIGIDTPETHSGSDKPIGEYGEQAYEFNKKLISNAQNVVELEFDKDLYDRYHRLLAYVYVKNAASSVMINSELIKHGLAWPLTYTDTSKHTMEFWKDYRYAYQHRLGLFSRYTSAPTVDASVVDKSLSEYLGKLTWVRFHPFSYEKTSYSITLSSTYFSVTVRTPELGEFATPLKTLYLHKWIEVYGEVWKKENKGEMLLHAPFEFKILQGG